MISEPWLAFEEGTRWSPIFNPAIKGFVKVSGALSLLKIMHKVADIECQWL
jgi:hypothetical protein